MQNGIYTKFMTQPNNFLVTVILLIIVLLGSNLFQWFYFSKQLKISWHKGFTRGIAEESRNSQLLIKSLLDNKTTLNAKSLLFIRMILKETVYAYNYNLKYAKEEFPSSPIDYLGYLENRKIDAQVLIELFEKRYGEEWENATVKKFVEAERKRKQVLSIE